MLNIERALNQDRLLRALTSLNQKAFNALLPSFEELYEHESQQYPRQREKGAGRKAKLKGAREKLFYIRPVGK